MTSERRAWVVFDLGFGDAGKGLCCDYLARRTGSGLVVRYNGGAQAGHNVVTPDGRHHTFAQLGAGTFAGARTWLSGAVVVHPTALLVEARVLEEAGVAEPLARLGVADGAKLVTPWHQALNRLRELSRGAGRHGSCGAGIGETVEDAARCPGEVIVAGDLRNRAVLLTKARRARERLLVEVRGLPEGALEGPEASRERGLFDASELVEAWVDRACHLAPMVRPERELGAWLRGERDVIFEGAQGVLLDQDRGFYPHTTWSRCGPDAARPLLEAFLAGAAIERVGVVRSHAVRHGAGPLPTEVRELDAVVQDHNRENAWQGRVRYGWFDAVLARYALAASGGADTLLLTHLDVAERLGRTKLCAAYREGGDRVLEELPVPSDTAIEAQAELGRRLRAVTPVLEECPGGAPALLRAVERALGRAVELVSRGPRASDISAPTRG